MSQPDAMTRFACPRCRRPMQARAEYAGRSTRCPGCKDSITIPGPDAETAAPARRSGRLVAVGLVVLLLALGGAVAAWRFWPRGGGTNGPPKGSVPYVFDDFNDLDLLPATAQGVVTLRAAELWQRPAVQKALAELRRQPNRPDPAAELEATVGLTPAEVERLSLVLTDGDKNLGYGVARTVNPYDGPKVLAKFRTSVERTHLAKSYYAGTAANGQPGAVCFVSPRVLLMGPEAGVKRGIEVLTTPAPQGPLAGAVELARGGKHHGVLGACPASGGTAWLKADKNLAYLADIKTVTGTLSVGEKSVLDVSLAKPDEEQSEKLYRNLLVTLGGARILLGLAKLNAEQAEGAKTAEKLLNALKISRKGTDVRLRAEVDEETAAALLLLAMTQVPR